MPKISFVHLIEPFSISGCHGLFLAECAVDFSSRLYKLDRLIYTLNGNAPHTGYFVYDTLKTYRPTHLMSFNPRSLDPVTSSGHIDRSAQDFNCSR